nr:MAG TPA: hypothetical protein [Bacteriophage sp.]
MRLYAILYASYLKMTTPKWGFELRQIQPEDQQLTKIAGNPIIINLKSKKKRPRKSIRGENNKQ